MGTSYFLLFTFYFQFSKHLLERLGEGWDDFIAEEVGEWQKDELPFGDLGMREGQLFRFAGKTLIQKDVDVDGAAVIERLPIGGSARLAGTAQLPFDLLRDG